MSSGSGYRKRGWFSHTVPVYAIACAVVLWGVAVAFVLYRDYKAGLTSIQASFGHIAGDYVPVVAEAVRDGKADAVEDRLEGILRFQDVVYAEVTAPFGRGGEVHTEAGDVEASRDFVRKYSLPLQDAVLPDGEAAKAGILTVAASRTGLRERLIHTGLIMASLGGVLIAFVAVALNATLGRRWARRLLDAETHAAQYRKLVETVGVGVTLMDREHRILMTNGVHSKMLGRCGSDATGGFCYAEFMDRDTVCNDCPATRAMDEKQPVETVKYDRCEDGEHRWLRRQAFPVLDDVGEVQGFVEVVDDVSRQQQMREALATASREMKAVLDASHDVVFLKDLDGVYTHVSATADSFFGVSREQLLGRQDARFLGPKERKAIEELEAGVLTGKTVRREETRVVLGESRVFEVTRSPLRDASGEVVGLCGVARDVTEARRIEDRLEDHQKKLLSMLDWLPEYAFMLGADGSISYANGAFRQLYGDPGGRFADDVLRGRPIPMETCPAFRVFETHQPETWEWTDVHGHTYLVHDVPFEGADGALCVLEIGFDISDRLKVERSLQESETGFRRLADNAQDMIYRLALPSRQCEYASPAALALTGYAPSEFAGDTALLSAVIHEDWIPAVHERWDAVARGEAPEALSHKIVQKSGDERWVNHRFVPVRDEQGDLLAVEGFLTDITGWKRAAESIQNRIDTLTRPVSDASETTFEDLFDLEEVQGLQDAFAAAMGVAAIITDPLGRPLTRPSNFCRLCRDVIRKTDLGLANCMRSDAVLGRPHPEGPIVQSCLSGGLWEGGASITVGEQHIANWLIGQVRNDCQSEEQMMTYAREIGADENAFREALAEVPMMSTERFETVCSALFMFANQLSRMAYQNMQQARAIHAREKAEAELTRIRDRLEELISNRTKELEAAQGELLRRQRLATLGQIIATVSHELRNPLGTMRSSLFTMRERLSGKGLGVDPAMARVERSILRCDAIIEELLDFTRLKRPDLQMAELDGWVSSVIDELPIPSHVAVVRRLSSGLKLEYDRDILRRALVNVVNNACQAMPDDRASESRLIVGTVAAGDRAEIRVRDTGEGISKADVDRVFEPLFSTKNFGVGLGLSIVRQIMQRHGGDVSIESEPGQGTEVTLWWPCQASGGASYEKEVAHSDRG